MRRTFQQVPVTFQVRRIRLRKIQAESSRTAWQVCIWRLQVVQDAPPDNSKPTRRSHAAAPEPLRELYLNIWRSVAAKSEHSTDHSVLVNQYEFLSADFTRCLLLCVDRQGRANIVKHRRADKSRHKAHSNGDFGVHGQVLIWGNRQSNHPLRDRV